MTKKRRTRLPKSTWWKSDGYFTLSAEVVRALGQSRSLTGSEIYYLFHELGIEERFRNFWQSRKLLQEIGMGDQAAAAEDDDRSDHLVRVGDCAWAIGNEEEARDAYEESERLGVLQGVGGLARLNFAQQRWAECLDAFRRACPSQEYYERYQQLVHSLDEDRNEQFEFLHQEYPDVSPCFVSEGKYMLQAVTMAAWRCEMLREEVVSDIARYFEVAEKDVQRIAKAQQGNPGEFQRLRKRVVPKKATSGMEHEDVMRIGRTDRSLQLCELVLAATTVSKDVAASIDAFLARGREDALDEAVRQCGQFVDEYAGELVLTDALEKRRRQIARLPGRHLALIRRFCPVCRFWPSNYLDVYLELMTGLDVSIEAGDIINGILQLQWYKTKYEIDDTKQSGKKGGLGKTEISRDREWLELLLKDYVPAFERAWLSSRDDAIAVLHSSYQHLKQRWLEARQGERWVNEAMLGKALVALFGKEKVKRHARPVWLSPQHLDFFVEDLSIAVEYMGLQHYEPVSVFGGEEALQATRERDQRKRRLCEGMGVRLFDVRHDEDVGQRAKEIYNEVLTAPGASTGDA